MKTITGRTIAFMSAGLVVLIGLTFWYWSPPAQSLRPYAGPVEKISISAVSSSTSGLLLIAQAKGYFRDNGLEATLKFFPTGPLGLEQLQAGQIDIAHVSDFVLVQEIFKGAKSLRCLGSIGTTDVIHMMALKDRGILQPGDLKGKSIGVARGTIAEFFLGRFLTFNQLSLSDIHLISLTPEETPAVLANGQVDAAMVWDPIAYDINQRLGNKIISWPGQTGQKFYNVLVGRDEFIKSRSKALERLFLALAQAETFSKNNRDESLAIIAKHLNLDQAIFKSTWLKSSYELSFDQALLISMEDEARWMIKNKLTGQTRIPNYLDYLNAEPLTKVTQQAVSIIIPKDKK
jgi:NitT/TauT family transport system substrate-binding protein